MPPSQDAPGAAADSGSSVDSGSLRKKYLALGTGMAALAVAVGAVVAVNADRGRVSTSQAKVTNPADTPPNTTAGSTTSPATTGEPTNQPSSAGLPAHMKRTHDGPVKVVNFPFQCPGVAPGSSASPSRNYQTDTPINPIDYCRDNKLMGRVNPDLAVVVSRQGHTFLEDRHPAASSTPFPSKGAKQAALHQDALPAGTTYTGVDFEVKFAPHSHELYKDGLCPSFADYVSRHRAALTKVAGDRWVTKVVTPGKSDLKFADCHQRRIDMGKRTVYLMEMANVAGQEVDRHRPDDKYTKLMGAVYDSVNTKCLPLKEAVAAATKAAHDTKSSEFGRRPVRMAVPSGGECARLYRYPSGRLEFIAFGS